MIKGIIIEGLPTAGKTSLLSALKRIHGEIPGGARTLVAVSEHYTQVLHSDHGVLRRSNQEEHLRLLTRQVDYLEQLNDWILSLGSSTPSHAIFYLLERFHLGHRAAFTDWRAITSIEKRLLKLNAHCALLTISPSAVERRYIESRGTEWKSYAMEGHATISEACDAFIDDQEQYRICGENSLVPTLEINTDDQAWETYAARLLRL